MNPFSNLRALSSLPFVAFRRSRALAIFAAILTTQTQAILDTNANLLSDLWEKQHNNGNLFAATILANNDEDQDGWTNAQEAAAGTDPLDPNPPDGIVTVTITPSFTAGAFTLTWPTFAGKNYQLKVSTDLTTWTSLGEPITTNQTTHSIGINTIQPDTTIPPKVFWQVVVTDLDSDLDGLTNSEENALGTNPNLADSDGDTLNDKAEILASTNPLDEDTDEDGLNDNLDLTPLQNDALTDPDGTNLATHLNNYTTATNGVRLIARYDFEALPVGANNDFPSSIPSVPAAVALNVGLDRFANPSGMPSFCCQWNAAPTANEYLSLPHQILNERSQYTWSYWLKLPKNAFVASAQNTGIRSLLSIGINRFAPSVLGTSSPLPALHWYCDIATGKIRAETYQIQIGTAAMLGSGWDIPAAWNDGEWHHIVLHKNDTNYKIYFDGADLGKRPSNNIDVPLTTNSYTLIGRRDLTTTTQTNTAYRFPPGSRLDRLRCYTALTQADVTALFNHDIDRDGLHDRTESRVRYWIDRNANGLRNADESDYVQRPFHHDAIGTDHDRDGIASHTEQASIIKTNPSLPDSDGDLMLDGWELANGLNPLVNDATADKDLDGVSNIDEYRYASNANNTDSDGDGTSDATEISQGSHPNDARDGGQPIPVSDQLPILLGVGDESSSHSEDYVINCFRINPVTGAEMPYYVLRSGGQGQYAEQTINIFRKEDTYTFQIKWISSSLQQNYNDGEPDFDYTLKILPDSDDVIKFDSLRARDWNSNHAHTIVQQNASNVITFHDLVETRRFCVIPKYFSINEFGNVTMSPGLAILKGKTIEFHLNSIAENKWSPTNLLIYLYQRKMLSNLQFGEWEYVDKFTNSTLHHKLVTNESGIFQYKAEVRVIPTLPTNVYFLRNSDERIGTFEYGTAKKGDFDCVGICDEQIQLDLLASAQSFYGSTDYDFDNPQPAAYGFPAMDAQTLRCNMFVAHRGMEVGASVPKINGLSELRWPPLANEWAGIESTSLIPLVMTTEILHWTLLLNSVPPQPGWIIAHPSPGDSGHCGIIDYNGSGIGAGESGTVNSLFDFTLDGTSRFRKYAP